MAAQDFITQRVPNEEGTVAYPPPPVPQASGKDNSQLLGIIGIIVGLICCSIAGIILGIVSLMQANKYGSTRMWGILAIVASVVNIIVGGIYYAAYR